MFFLFSHYCLCCKGEAEDEEHSKSPLFLMLTCSLRDKSSHTQPMTPVSINMLPVCLGNDYSGFQLKHWLSILGPTRIRISLKLYICFHPYSCGRVFGPLWREVLQRWGFGERVHCFRVDRRRIQGRGPEDLLPLICRPNWGLKG